MRILLVEDDPMIGESMEEALRGAGYAPDWVRDGLAAELALRAALYDLLLLDLGLPGRQGMEVLRRLRAAGGVTPVLIVSARDATAARIAGLDAGADDYLVKPFDLDELLARIRAVLRRHGGRSTAWQSHGGLALNPAAHEALYRGRPLQLSAREFALLRVLFERPGAVVSKASLEEKIYGGGAQVESNAIDVYIHHLRKKLGAAFIKNVRGVGYKLASSG